MQEIPQEYREVAKKVAQQYPQLVSKRANEELLRIQKFAPDPDSLSDKIILDLGAGSTESLDRGGWLKRFIDSVLSPESAPQFEPWFCRVLEVAGGEPFAVDIGDNSIEPFRAMKLDLSEPTALQAFGPESFDGVNNHFFTASRSSEMADFGSSPALFKEFMKRDKDEMIKVLLSINTPINEWKTYFKLQTLMKLWDLDDQIKSEVTRILKDGGIYAHNEVVLVKKGDRLEKI